MPTSDLDSTVFFLEQWLVYGKANTIFATLFGIGIWVQLERLRARGGDFERIYVRRLSILLALGAFHAIFIWVWDILHLYALAGFALFFMRKLSARAFLVLGLLLAILGELLISLMVDTVGLPDYAGLYFSDTAIVARQTASQAGDYLALLEIFTKITFFAWIGQGVIVGWALYALGRFLLGAFIARKGWIRRATELRKSYILTLLVALPVGLGGQYIVASVNTGAMNTPGDLEWVLTLLHEVSKPILSLAYGCALILVFHSAARPLVVLFGPVGRMALTNYVSQSFFIGYLLFGIGPGRALAGYAGTAHLAVQSLYFFAFQIAFSVVWLRLFNYGPLEYLWRWATYGRRPRLVRTSAAEAQPA